LRSAPAITILLLLGLFLIVVGFIRLPYVAVETQTVEVITYNTYRTTITYTSEKTLIKTLEETLTTAETYLNTVIRLETTTYTQLDIESLLNVTILMPGDAEQVMVGPLHAPRAGVLRVLWESNADINLLILDTKEPNPLTYLNATGSLGLESIQLDNPLSFYLVIMRRGLEERVYASITVYFEQAIPITRTYTVESTETSVSTRVYKTTIYSGYTTVATSLETTTTRTAYPTTVVKQVTQTRYQELTFSTAMGAFLVFASIMLIILFRRLRYAEWEEVNGLR